MRKVPVTNVLDIAKQHQLGRVTEEVTTGNNFTVCNVAPEVSGLARAHRDGRGAENAPNGAMFTEGWFRDSGLYDLEEKYQLLELASERRANHG